MGPIVKLVIVFRRVVVLGGLKDSLLVVGSVSMTAVVKVLFRCSEVGEEVSPLKEVVVTRGGGVLEIALHDLSGDSYVGDGALAEFPLQGRPANKRKATVISFVLKVLLLFHTVVL